MSDEPSPVWWRIRDLDPPTDWRDVYDALTSPSGVDEWGLAAAVFIARTRRRTGRGPTFAELFGALLPDSAGLPAQCPQELSPRQRRAVVYRFRVNVALAWRRRNLINWDRDRERSLRVGRRFREISRRRAAELRGSRDDDRRTE